MTVSTAMLDSSIRSRFAPDTVYLDSATFGLPPDSVVAAMRAGVDQWQRGTATPAEYDGAVDRSRALFAQLVGVPPDHVAVANQVSVLVGTVAASLPDGSHVVTVEDDFTSLLFPLYAQAHRGVTVTTVPLEGLADSIDGRTDLVACSLVQSGDGRVAELDAVIEAAERHGARTLVDGTQAAGWLPIDASRVDHLVVGAYKWLLSPRGTAFLTVRPDHLADLRPVAPGWYAGEDVWGSIYGPTMQLAASARCADVSPAWLCWLGTVPALELILEIGVDRIHAHDVALADAIREGLGLPGGASAIVSIPTSREVDLARHGITASVRAGSLRVGCHLYNDLSDVEALLSAVGPDVETR
jgi:selenocysteine lyase/cysteine desulfurase